MPPLLGAPAAAPPPDGPPSLSPRRAYVEIAAVYLIAFGPVAAGSLVGFLWSLGLISLGLGNAVLAWTSPCQIWLPLAGWAVALVMAGRARPWSQQSVRPCGRIARWAGSSPARYRTLVGAAALLSAPLALWMGIHARALGAGDMGWRVLQAAIVCVLAVVLVCTRGPGVAAQLGLRPRAGRSDGETAHRVFDRSVAGIALTGLAFLLIRMLGTLIAPAAAAASGTVVIPRPTLSGVLRMALDCGANAIAEEALLSALMVATLAAAGRSRREIYAVAALLRIAFHLYKGVAGLGAGVFAAMNAGLFLRYRRVLPLILGHAVCDFTAMLPRPAGLAVACVVIAAGTLDIRRIRRQPDPAAA